MSMVRVVLSVDNVVTLRGVIEDELRERVEEIRETEISRPMPAVGADAGERADEFYQDVLELLQSDLVSLYVLFLGEDAEEEAAEPGEDAEEVSEAEE